MSREHGDDDCKALQDAPNDLAAMRRAVMEAYRDFAGGEPDEKTAKAFGAHHSACKAALAHLETLMKLERAATGETRAPGGPDLRPELGAARAAIRDLAEGGPGGDSDDDG